MLQVFIPAWQVRTMDTEMLALSQQRIFKYYVDFAQQHAQRPDSASVVLVWSHEDFWRARHGS